MHLPFVALVRIPESGAVARMSQIKKRARPPYGSCRLYLRAGGPVQKPLVFATGSPARFQIDCFGVCQLLGTYAQPASRNTWREMNDFPAA